MKVESLKIDKLITERLILIPFTLKVCKNLLNNNYSDLEDWKLKKGKIWPDNDAI